MGSTGDDPRTDKSSRPGDPSPPKDPGDSRTHPAPGGAGTGTKDDPAKAPDAGASHGERDNRR